MQRASVRNDDPRGPLVAAQSVWIGEMNDDAGPEGIEAVRKWIRETGYPLEYAVARTLQRAGFRTAQGVHYVAVAGDETKAREIDVLATAVAPDTPAGPIPFAEAVRVRLVAECKVLRFPWVVLTREYSVGPFAAFREALASGKARGVLLKAAENAGWAVPDLFQMPARHGFNVVEARPPSAAARRQAERSVEDDRVDGAYAALTQVMSASVSLQDKVKATWSVTWPVLVVRGSLFHLGYEDDGTEVLEPVEWQRVRWAGHPTATTYVDIVRERHFATYASTAHAGLVASAQRLGSAARAARRH